jgi:hypothetical protein
MKLVMENVQLGGVKHKKITGTRNMITYSEHVSNDTYGGDSVDDDEESYDSKYSTLSSIARVVTNQSSDAHRRSVERIKEILKVDDVEARAYKAILYEEIKKEGNKSNYDKAMELEKRASNESILKKISKKDVANMIKLIDDKYKLKQTSSESNRSSEPKRNKKISSESGNKKTFSDSENYKNFDNITSITSETSY